MGEAGYGVTGRAVLKSGRDGFYMHFYTVDIVPGGFRGIILWMVLLSFPLPFSST
jgi:hypothetical protein